MLFATGGLLSILTSLQAPSEPAEVKYNVAFIAGVATLAAAVVSLIGVVVAQLLNRRSLSKLQREQAALTNDNQVRLANLQTVLSKATGIDLARLQSELSLQTGKELEAEKAELSEKVQTRVELFRAKLGEMGKESAARREYEHDAHKRLYAECEPLLFQLAELSDHAYYRIYSLARTAQRGDLPNWLNGDSYYLRSTMYKLIAPLVIFRIIQQRLTFVDLSLDLRIAEQYGLLKFLYFTFTDSFDFAKLAPEIEYDPDKDGWEELRKTDQKKYWRQGLYLGALDNSIDALIVSDDQRVRWRTYGEFESEYRNKDSATHRAFGTLADVLDGFHPQNRPVLWRMLWTQTLIHKKIIDAQSSPGSSSRVGLAAVSPQLPSGSLDWRRDPKEAPDEEVLSVPEKAAKRYLHARMPAVFDQAPTE
jgi:hypothetical protein